MMLTHFNRLTRGKHKKILPLITLFVTFLITLLGSCYISNKIFQYVQGEGYDYKNIIALTPKLKDDPAKDAEIFSNFRQSLIRLKTIEKAAFTDGAIPYQPSPKVQIFFNGQAHWFHSFGGDEHIADLLNIKLQAGKWFSSQQDQDAEKSIVLTAKAASYISSDSPETLIGKTVNFGGRKENFKVIGIVRRFKVTFQDEAPVIFTYQSQPSRTILVKHRPNADMAQLDKELKGLLNQLPITPISNEDLTEGKYLEAAREEAFKESKTKISFPGIISLFVFFNVMVVFLVITFGYVRKRKQEIGVRRAVGATRISVYQSILTENLLFTSIAYALALIVFLQVATVFPESWDKSYSTIGASSATSLIYLLIILCTLYPARQAAKIHPVEALAEE
ncbi:FtsX-like permease family protein [Puteibacter caeruleilacunae]|nr:FtsX-like permease family protein [Puteibacter caeruleilacunae]